MFEKNGATTKTKLARTAAALLATSALLLSAYVAATAQQKSPGATKRSVPSRRASNPGSAVEHLYACPMHTEVTSASSEARCPKCGMNLTKRDATAAKTDGQSAPGAGAQPGEGMAVSETALQIPDVPVVDQDGRRLNFYSDLVKGRTVAINFIFTTCTTICPPLSATFGRVQRELGGRVGSEVSLISVSVDPVTDTPERLKSFASKFNAGPGWTFVTGGRPEISSLLKALDAYVADRNDHTPMILVGNAAAGNWTRTYGLAPPSKIVKVINEVAATKAGAKVGTGTDEERGNTTEASAKYFPNHVLLTQEGREVRFYEDVLKGKVVLINFMFTTCAGICPPMTANLAKVQSYLGERVGREVRMVSITVDPATDTPEAMRDFAAKHKAGPGWYFLTGRKENVDWVLYKLGGFTEEKEKHSGVLILGNEATGEWMKVHAMAKPSEIAAAVVKLLDGGAEQR